MMMLIRTNGAVLVPYSNDGVMSRGEMCGHDKDNEEETRDILSSDDKWQCTKCTLAYD